MTPKEKLKEAISKLGLAITSDFIPWSESRNSKNRERSLNWRVTLHKDGARVLTTDFSSGIGHCPSYRAADRSIVQRDLIEHETESGYAIQGRRILPEITDVVSGLITDLEVINHPSYDSYAAEYGLDPDSRKGETAYRVCLEIALALRRALGETGLQALRVAARDY